MQGKGGESEGAYRRHCNVGDGRGADEEVSSAKRRQ